MSRFPTPQDKPIPLDQITTDNTALLVIDMEKDFVAEDGAMTTPGALAIVPVINKLIAWSREHGLPIIFTREMHRADRSDYGIELEYDPVHCVEGTTGSELVDGLDYRRGDYQIVAKRRYDCFMGTDLDLLLRSIGIENVVACGVTTHQCVMSTVFTARHLDYRVLVPPQACAGVSEAHHAAALLCMSDVFAYVTDVDTVLGLYA